MTDGPAKHHYLEKHPEYLQQHSGEIQDVYQIIFLEQPKTEDQEELHRVEEKWNFKLRPQIRNSAQIKYSRSGEIIKPVFITSDRRSCWYTKSKYRAVLDK